MNAVLLSAVTPVGDDFTVLSWALLGAVVLTTGVVTWIITPKTEKH